MAGPFKTNVKYVPCISVDDLPGPGGATSGVSGGLAICIAVDEKGSIFALGDKCPPVNQPLSFERSLEEPSKTLFSEPSSTLRPEKLSVPGAHLESESSLEDFSTQSESLFSLSRRPETKSKYKLM